MATKVLLAEDDIDDQQIFLDFLKDRKDLQLMTVVENGVVLMETLETITEDALLPDIIILDQNMPKRNGLQTLELLKAHERYAHIPVMVYSTYADHQLLSSCSKMGATAVYTKPITKAEYNKMLDAFLNMAFTS